MVTGNKIYMGSTEIVKSYLGTTQVDYYPQSKGTNWVVRTDAYSSSLVLAMPMQLASNLGMTNYYDDISATIKGTGSNYKLVPTGSGILTTTGSVKFPSDGYQTALYIGYNSAGVDAQVLGTITTTAANFGSSDFVIECFINLPSTSIGGLYNSNVFGQNSGDYLLADTSTFGSSIRFYKNGGGGPVSVTQTANQWVHVAYVRSGNNFYSYWNGTRYGNFSAAGAVNNSPDGFWRILGYAESSYECVPKLVQDFRLYIGTDKGYTGATITAPQSMIYSA